MKLVIPRRILYFLGMFASLGAGFALWLRGTLAGTPDPRTSSNAFYVLFARDEVLGLLLVAAFCIGAAIYFFHAPSPTAEGSPPRIFSSRFVLPAAMLAVFAITALGTEFVCHDYALSADEFMADFQARIFLRGEITAEVPAQWQPVVRVIKPTYVDYFPATHRWKAAYLPVYAAMRAVFQGAYLETFLNPSLAAITLLALYGLVRNSWPNEKQNAVVAVLLLGASTQFLLMGMTGYAMSAHLALNTIWLWLYSRPDRRRFYLAPIVGVFAIGLHQPIVHAIFVAPFLLRLLRDRNWRAVSVFGFIYLVGCAGWYAWRAHYSTPSGPGITSFFRLWAPRVAVVQSMNLLLIIGWSALAMPLLAVLGFSRIFRARPIVQDAAMSCLLTFGFYCFFIYDQGHGWGYRYFHGTLSCLILVAVAGWEVLMTKTGSRAARNYLLAGVAVSLIVGLPLRCYEAEGFIRPFVRASEAIHGMNVRVVGLDLDLAWYSADLIRNDPFLQDRPIVVALVRLQPLEVALFSHAGRSHFVTKEEVAAWGLAPVHRYR